ncbi:MAG: 2,3-bisphosphoglycerate-independent phosphoglycerate mutase [Anaerovoracaceae bacterium]
MNTILMILDGFGYSEETYGNAIAQAYTPTLDHLFNTYPSTLIKASGLAVGLPQGQMGNSEVGHLNIGAGRVVYQELTRISSEIESKDFFKNPALNEGMDLAKSNDKALHIMGLLSDGGVHSHINHVYPLIYMAKMKGLTKVYVHAFLDGRDVPPRCAQTYLSQLEAYLLKSGLGRIGMISGRYYAMDRDNRWERVKKAYEALTLGKGEKAPTALDGLYAAYDRGEDDEFVSPTIVSNENNPFVPISDGDTVIMFNFRPDRAREITRSFVDEAFNGFVRTKPLKSLCYICMTQYDAEMPNVLVAYPPQSLKNTLGEYLAGLGLRQLRIAETEKYAHVTFFFNGGMEAPNNGEDRILIPSPKVATYDLQPEMSAYQVTDSVIEQIQKEKYHFIILNYANPDMVGHTGSMKATITAIEVLDKCIARVLEAVMAHGGQMLITSDHGNADTMLTPQGDPITAHSTNCVPLIAISHKPIELAENGVLADIVPTLLDLAGMEKPLEMTGHSLIKGDNL